MSEFSSSARFIGISASVLIPRYFSISSELLIVSSSRYLTIIIIIDAIIPITIPINVHFVIDGETGAVGRLAESTTLTASISITCVICFAARSLTALAIFCACSALGSVTVIAIIRVSLVLTAETLPTRLSYVSLRLNCLITPSIT